MSWLTMSTEKTNRAIQLLSVGFVAVAIGMLGSLALGYFNRQDINVTQRTLEKSPCYKSATDPNCQNTKAATDRAQSVADACIQFRNVGYECPVGAVKRAIDSGDLDPDVAPVPSDGSGSSTTLPPKNETSQLPPESTKPPAVKPSPKPIDPGDSPQNPPSVGTPIPEPDPEPAQGGLSEALGNVLDTTCKVTNQLGICVK